MRKISQARVLRRNDRGGEERVCPVAAETYERVKKDAAEELGRPVPALAFAGLFAGATLGSMGLLPRARQVVGSSRGAAPLAAVFYPIGFIATIIGRAQLFTENTSWLSKLWSGLMAGWLLALVAWLSAVMHGTVGVAHFFAWLSAVIVGNILGGVVIVALLNYGQVRAGEG